MFTYRAHVKHDITAIRRIQKPANNRIILAVIVKRVETCERATYFTFVTQYAFPRAYTILLPRDIMSARNVYFDHCLIPGGRKPSTSS
ncbi:hypothetical protein BT96DRAFT_1009977 [Gymnopus androsaceus JB14]|uniref:Uncharacterized protein n=1 Tax=Gymnopus androsaceus JB14 TaxID=1447944 RepID=A0A6A4GBE8_9AGAR|nr:hypothetical protein BT96DRAFT_1009977 [Gymnopus androsaceus JB14]